MDSNTRKRILLLILYRREALQEELEESDGPCRHTHQRPGQIARAEGHEGLLAELSARR